MKKRFIALLVLCVIGIIWWQPFNLGLTEVTIPAGATANQITDVLYENGIVRDRKEFLFWLRVSGREKNLKSGTYCLYKFKNPFYVIGRLSYGGYSDVTVTIPEGLTIRETARILATHGLIQQTDFIALCTNADFVKSLDIPAITLEGYLFPDTYSFSRTQSDSGIVATFVRNFKKRTTDYEVHKSDSLHKIVILASMVEKEAKYEDERPIIAKVFLNRLNQNRPLESCATVLFALRDIDYEAYQNKNKLLKRDLRIESAYNTYINTGLPPGPICSPGEQSLQAVIDPADVNFLYFVSKGNGRHHFSRTYKEHVMAKERYCEEN